MSRRAARHGRASDEQVFGGAGATVVLVVVAVVVLLLVLAVAATVLGLVGIPRPG